MLAPRGCLDAIRGCKATVLRGISRLTNVGEVGDGDFAVGELGDDCYPVSGSYSPLPSLRTNGGREVVRIVVRRGQSQWEQWLLGRSVGLGGLAGDGEAEVEGVEDVEEGVYAGVAFAGEGAVESLAS